MEVTENLEVTEQDRMNQRLWILEDALVQAEAKFFAIEGTNIAARAQDLALSGREVCATALRVAGSR